MFLQALQQNFLSVLPTSIFFPHCRQVCLESNLTLVSIWLQIMGELSFPGVCFLLNLLMRIDPRQEIESSINGCRNIGASRIKGIFWPVYRETELVVLYTDFHGLMIKELNNTIHYYNLLFKRDNKKTTPYNCLFSQLSVVSAVCNSTS